MASQGVSLAGAAALYRLLPAEAFGQVAMILPWIMLLRMVVSAGLGVSTVQSRQLSEDEASLLFWLNLGLSAAAAGVALALAPWVTRFYGQPDLLALWCALTGTGLVAALGSQHQALAERQMRLADLALWRLAAQALGTLIAVLGAACCSAGAWALVAQQYVEWGLLAGGSWQLARWWPRWPTTWRGAGHLLRFGGTYSLANLVFYLGQNLDKVLVGWLLGPRAAGYYSQASSLMMRPVYLLTTPLSGLLLPALARVAGQPSEFGQLIAAGYRLAAAFCFPAGVGLFIIAPEAMLTLGGPAWAEAGPLLRALSLTILVQPFVNLAGSILAAAGRADRLLVGAAVFTAVAGGSLWLGSRWPADPAQGAQGAAWGYSLGAGLLFGPAYLAWCLRSVATSAMVVGRQLLPALAAALGMGLALVVARPAILWLAAGRPAILLALEMTLGAGVYALLARGELAWCLAQWRRQ